MNILATSDMHGNLDGLDLSGYDIALFAGDIAPLKGISSWDAYDQLTWMNETFYAWCQRWPDTKVVFVPGNHDFFANIKARYGYKLDGLGLSLLLSPNATMLLDSGVEVDGIKIYGTPWVPTINHGWEFEAEHDKLVEKFSKIPEGLDILISHAPPKFNYLGISLQYGADSDDYGCYELADAVFKKEPKLCFCGHVHSGDHSMNKLGKTDTYNVSRVDESYSIAYEPTTINYV